MTAKLACLTCKDHLRLASENANLRKGLEHRTMIGVATGLLMGMYNIEQERAFSILKRLSNDTNVKLYKVAEEFIEQFNETIAR